MLESVKAVHGRSGGLVEKGLSKNDGNCEGSVLEPEVSHLFASKCGYEVTDKTCTQKNLYISQIPRGLERNPAENDGF